MKRAIPQVEVPLKPRSVELGCVTRAPLARSKRLRWCAPPSLLALLLCLSSCAAGDDVESVSTVRAASVLADGPSERVALEDADEHRRRWFRPLADYVADEELNPNGRTLSDAETIVADQIVGQATELLDSIERRFSAAQMAVARVRVDAGAAERYVAGQSDVARGDSIAVVIATFDETGPWLVRIGAGEIAEYDEWMATSSAARALAIEQLGELLRGESSDSPGLAK